MAVKRFFFFQNISPKTFFTLLVVVLFFWVFSRPFIFVGELFYNFFGSVLSNSFQAVIQSKSATTDLINAKKIIAKQRKEISNLKLKVFYLHDETERTKRLERILDLKKEINYKTISASVIGRTSDNWHKQIVLNKGTQDGIMIGSSVITDKGVVGQVVEVANDLSITQLLSDPGFRLGSKIYGKDIIGILVGKSNNTALLNFIPAGSNVEVGDLVVTSGISTHGTSLTYPPGHLIGTVSKIIKKNKRASDLYVEVKLAERLNSLSEVLVFLSGS